MPTQLTAIFRQRFPNFPKLEKEVNDGLAAKGDSIQPVNSQTATGDIANGRDHEPS